MLCNGWHTCTRKFESLRNAMFYWPLFISLSSKFWCTIAMQMFVILVRLRIIQSKQSCQSDFITITFFLLAMLLCNHPFGDHCHGDCTNHTIGVMGSTWYRCNTQHNGPRNSDDHDQLNMLSGCHMYSKQLVLIFPKKIWPNISFFTFVF